MGDAVSAAIPWRRCEPPTGIGRGSLGYLWTVTTQDGYQFWRNETGSSVAMRSPDGSVVRANNQGFGGGAPPDVSVRELLAMARA